MCTLCFWIASVTKQADAYYIVGSYIFDKKIVILYREIFVWKKSTTEQKYKAMSTYIIEINKPDMNQTSFCWEFNKDINSYASEVVLCPMSNKFSFENRFDYC